MDLGIKGLKVLVTAGAGGIGFRIAEAFLREGARVHVCDVDEGALASLARSGPEVSHSVCDVADRNRVEQLFQEASQQLGGLDCLVNNAGIAGPTGRVDQVDPAEWERCLAVDITGQFNCARLAVPLLLKSKNASIANLSSAAGRFGFPNRSAYAAAKWGVIGFTKTLAMELGGFGVRVNAILPGSVDGERIRRVFEAKAKIAGVGLDEIQKAALGHASIKQLIQPEQIADMIVFLASPRAKTVSGQAIGIDGDLQALV